MLTELQTLLEMPEAGEAEIICFIIGLKTASTTQAATIARLRTPRVEISDELRSEIESHLAWQAQQTAGNTATKQRLEGEITALQKTGRDLGTQALSLEAEVIRDADAATKLQGVNARREAIAQRVQELQDELAQVGPPSMISARALASNVLREYLELLPAAINAALEPFFLDASKSMPFHGITDAYQSLRVIRNVTSGGGGLDFNRVFQNALAGRLILLAEYQE